MQLARGAGEPQGADKAEGLVAGVQAVRVDPAQVEPVDAMSEIEHCVARRAAAGLGGRGKHEHVRSGASGHPVGAEAPAQPVGAEPAE